MLIVTGANGQFGRRAVGSLLDRVAADRVVASVREPAKAADLAARGVSVRPGDFADPAGLPGAFAGVERALIVSVNVLGPDGARRNAAAIEAAAGAGARQILYTSLIGVDVSDRFAPTESHRASEAALAASGVPGTVLRNGFYAEFAMMRLRDALATGVLAAPADGPVAYTSRVDEADAAASILAAGSHAGETLTLTAAEAIDLAGLAALASDLLGRPIRREVIPDAAYRDSLVAGGMPPAMADGLAGFFAASRAGQFARVDPALARILGREPTPLRAVLQAALAGATA